MRTPIAITGVGVVSPAGTTADALWRALLRQDDRRGKWPKRSLSGYPIDNVISIPEDLWRTLNGANGTRENRARALADFVVTQALEEARVAADGVRLGCILASTTAGVEITENSVIARSDGEAAPSDFDGSSILPPRAWTGPVSVISTACSSGLMAPALAVDALLAGEADVMIAGGVDVLLEYTICGFNALRLTSDERCRPFATGRKGAVLSEGAVCFCLEPLDAARARGAPIRAVIDGYGIGCDADHVTAPNAVGVARVIGQAFETSGVARESIGGVFAHGTGTLANDASEVAALRAVFGDVAVPPITAIKSMLGHPQAAAGAFSLLAAILALQHRQLPPTAGVVEIDRDLNGVDVVREAAQPLAARTLMANAFGFGGNNCVMIVSAPGARESAS
ncbi:MAG: beta-ketoacyl-[acyl-carrier-protein] synthase family protein [Sulfurifustis sp.]